MNTFYKLYTDRLGRQWKYYNGDLSRERCDTLRDVDIEKYQFGMITRAEFDALPGPLFPIEIIGALPAH